VYLGSKFCLRKTGLARQSASNSRFLIEKSQRTSLWLWL